MLCVQLFYLGLYYILLQFHEKVFKILLLIQIMLKILENLDIITVMLWIPDQLCVVLVMEDWEIRYLYISIQCTQFKFFC